MPDDRLMLARKTLQVEKGLARLPKPDNREAVALAESGDLHPRASAAGLIQHNDFVQIAERRLAAKEAERDAALTGKLLDPADAMAHVVTAARQVRQPAFESAPRRQHIAKRQPFGRLLNLRQRVVDGVAYVLHSTRGWKKA